MHSALDQILRDKKLISDQVIDFSESVSNDSIWELESDPTIGDGENPIESIELESDESEDSDFEFDPNEDESSEDENDDEEAIWNEVSMLQSEAAASNKENHSIFHPKKQKENWTVMYDINEFYLALIQK